MTAKDVERFIGGAAFFRETVDDFGRLVGPMHRCTRNDVPEKDLKA